MSSESTTKREFRYPEEDVYAQVDGLAVVSLVCGSLSIAALIFSPIFMIPGVIGVIFGVVSLARIQQSEGTLSGFWVASIGIGLTLFVATTYFTYSASRKSRIANSAQKYALEWLDMIRTGKTREAHQLTKTYFDRTLPGTDLVAHYKSASADQAALNPELYRTSISLGHTPHEAFNEFYSRPILKILKEKGKDCDIKFVRVLDQWSDPPFLDYAMLEYEVAYEENGQNKKQLMAVTMLREEYPSDRYGVQWAVDMVDGKKGIVAERPAFSDVAPKK